MILLFEKISITNDKKITILVIVIIINDVTSPIPMPHSTI